MGLDYSYQALPDPCGPLARAIREPVFGGAFSAVSGRLEADEWLAWGGVWAECAQAWRELCVKHPGLEQRRFSLDRRWDKLHYLVSEARRHGRFDADDWGTHAILGAGLLADHLTGGQGVHLRYSPPDVVQGIAEHLCPMTEEELRRAWDPPRMQECAVYKFRVDNAGEEEWGRVAEAFRGLQAFYRQAASLREGVLVKCD
ncbi:DUF1877 family protein [Stigmatella aurantiaca]|nr:DUF1877 family protein [Stigmatella aurantiaca]EAU67119.1 hypothetical protein STIAU_2634 [Stigmatella aurantiaca DW4/3-1]